MKDVNDLMQAILEMDAAQRRESEKARLERSARLAALDEQKQKIIAECDAREKSESAAAARAAEEGNAAALAALETQRSQAAEAMTAAAKAHEAEWCAALVQRTLGGEGRTMMPTGKASGNAVLAKARALYGSRLRADDYRRLMACRTMTELAAALKEYPLYSEALAEVNPQYARRVQLENLLRQSLYTRYDSLCRYDRSAGSKVYEYFTLCCEVDELTAAMRCLDAGRPGDYLFRLPEFLQQRCCIDLYALAKATSLDGILAAVAGTRWEKVLAPLQSAKPDRGLTAQAEPLLQDFRHRALVALAPAKGGTSAAPNLRDLVELECDTSAVSNAARLIRIGAPDSVVRTNARRDCTALTNDEWEYLLAARDLDTFKARFARTKYGPLLEHHEYSVLKEGFFHYRCDWCRKWLRFSTDPTLVMLCYVWLARCEVQDLDHIIEGVHYKLPPEDVQPLLVGFDEKD